MAKIYPVAVAGLLGLGISWLIRKRGRGYEERVRTNRKPFSLWLVCLWVLLLISSLTCFVILESKHSQLEVSVDV